MVTAPKYITEGPGVKPGLTIKENNLTKKNFLIVWFEEKIGAKTFDQLAILSTKKIFLMLVKGLV